MAKISGGKIDGRENFPAALAGLRETAELEPLPGNLGQTGFSQERINVWLFDGRRIVKSRM
jgi:hypothetical protein